MRARWWGLTAIVSVLLCGACGFGGWWWLRSFGRAIDEGLQSKGDMPMTYEYARELLPKEITDFRLVSGWYVDGGFHPGNDPRNVHALVKPSDVPALDTALTRLDATVSTVGSSRHVVDKPTEIKASFDLAAKTNPTVPAGSVTWGVFTSDAYRLDKFVLCPPRPAQPGDDGFTVDFYYVGEVD